VLFHFQFKGPAGWEPVGSGEAEREDAVGLRRAAVDLSALAGGLEPGTYRAIAAKGASTRWLSFRIGADGSFFGDDEIFDQGDRP
jgi:hypothetical protein